MVGTGDKVVSPACKALREQYGVVDEVFTDTSKMQKIKGKKPQFLHIPKTGGAGISPTLMDISYSPNGGGSDSKAHYKYLKHGKCGGQKFNDKCGINFACQACSSWHVPPKYVIILVSLYICMLMYAFLCSLGITLLILMIQSQHSV